MLPHYTYKREQVLENTGPTITVQANVMINPQGKVIHREKDIKKCIIARYYTNCYCAVPLTLLRLFWQSCTMKQSP